MSKLSNYLNSLFKSLEHKEITHREANEGYRNGKLSDETMKKMYHNRSSVAWVVIVIAGILILLFLLIP